MVHGIFTTNRRLLAVELREWQRRLHRAYKPSRVAHCRRMIEMRYARLFGRGL